MLKTHVFLYEIFAKERFYIIMCNRILHNINYCSDSSKYKIFSLHKNSLKLFWIGYLKKKTLQMWPLKITFVK